MCVSYLQHVLLLYTTNNLLFVCIQIYLLTTCVSCSVSRSLVQRSITTQQCRLCVLTFPCWAQADSGRGSQCPPWRPLVWSGGWCGEGSNENMCSVHSTRTAGVYLYCIRISPHQHPNGSSVNGVQLRRYPPRHHDTATRVCAGEETTRRCVVLVACEHRQRARSRDTERQEWKLPRHVGTTLFTGVVRSREEEKKREVDTQRERAGVV